MTALTVPETLSTRWLLGDLVTEAVPDVEIDSLTQLAEDALPGGLYLALAGSRFHGLDFAAEAIGRGAIAVAWEPVAGRAEPALPVGIASIPVPGLRALAGTIADRFYALPSAAMRVAGVTGTNGKTTCTFYIAQALEQLGRRCAVMGTLGTGRPGRLEPTRLTTPDVVSVHRNLAQLLAEDTRYVAMEVSSHALVQGRVNAVRFSCAAFTNLSHDHLDYHGDLESYGEAKARLFTQHLDGVAVINAADAWGRRLLGQLPEGLQTIVVSPDPGEREPLAWLAAEALSAGGTGLSFDVVGSFGKARLESSLVGDFNAGNLLLALGVLLGWGFGFEESVEALQTVRSPAGRMETFGGGQRPLVIVDFAHTPDALKQALRSVRSHARGRLIVVFGCGGERDRGKRSAMGDIACSLADLVFVTDDNPRDEDPAAIVADILSGASGEVTVEHDRAAAIALAVSEAECGDVVLIAGKGHETYQTTRNGRQPFSDRQVVADLLGKHSAGSRA